MAQVIAKEKRDCYGYTHFAAKLSKPRICKRWLFSISGFLAPFTGLISGFVFSSHLFIAIGITYSAIWGLSAFINACCLWDGKISLLVDDPTSQQIIEQMVILQCQVESLQTKNKKLEEESARLLELVEPQLNT